MRKQNGSITQFNGKWYLRYWERRLVDGNLERKRATHYLGEVMTRGRKPPETITKAAEDHMRNVLDCTIPPERVISLKDFAETVYLPWVKQNLRPSTYRGYRGVWEDHIRAASGRDSAVLKDVQCYTVQRWLNVIAKEDLGRNSLKHVKSTLSGMFRLARQLGFYSASNPVRDSRIDPHAAEPGETYAYTLEDVQTILAVLPEPAATLFAVASYAGLRRGELEGLEWPDYHDGALHVSRSIWNGKTTAPKTKKSCAAVPVIKQLAERLELHRMRSGSPASGPIFRNSLGQPLNINNLLNRVILPAVDRCGVCRLPKGKPHLKQDHDYKRDASLPEWHGLHACRRGLGSNLYRLGASDKVCQAILRHSNVATTLGYYVKPNGPDVVAAMGKLEQETAVQILRDCNGTVKLASGANPESVN
jgi:integrase